MSLAVADLSDAHPDCAILRPGLLHFGGRRRFFGPARTLKVFEDNALVRAALESPGEGAVLVIDGGGSQRCALVGGMLGELAVAQRWQGIIVHGCIRDSLELAAQDVGVMAMGTHPRKSAKGAFGGQCEVAVHFLDTTIAPGDWIYADEDGVLVSAQRLD
jgi:regulator of ribonuclease activity A